MALFLYVVMLDIRRTFEAYFHWWADLTTLTTRCLDSTKPEVKTLRAVEYKTSRVELLLRQLRHPTVSATTDSIMMMKEILDEVLPGTGPQGENQFDPGQLLALSHPCRLPTSNYLVVLLQISLLETKTGPLLGTIGFRNSHRGSWFVPLDPGRDSTVSAASATSIGFVQTGGDWRWGAEGSLACLGEAEALLCLLSALTAERANSGAQSVVLVTARRAHRAIGVLVGALQRSGHLQAFLNLVAGLGDLEGVAKARGVALEEPGLQPLTTWWQKSQGRTLDLGKQETVPKALFQVRANINCYTLCPGAGGLGWKQSNLQQLCPAFPPAYCVPVHKLPAAAI